MTEETPPVASPIAQLDVVLEAAPVAIVIVDGDGLVVLANAQAEALFGYPRDELVGASVEQLVPERFQPEHPDLRGGYQTRPTSRPMGAGRELFARRKNGSEVPVEIGLNPIATADGTFVLAAVIDITERKRAEEHFRSVVEAAPNAMILADSDGAITLINAQTERLFGYSRGELLGRSVEMLVPERFRTAHPGLRDGYAQDPAARPMGAGRELFGLRKDGSEVPIEIGLNPLRTPQGHFVLASIIDITERKHAEELRLQNVGMQQQAVQLEALNRELESASRLKSQFVATMSHELRTPLNAIIGMTELLDLSSLEERQRVYVETINQSAEALLGIINSILDFSKIEAGKLELQVRDFEIEAVVGGASDVVAPSARAKGVTLHAYVDPLIPNRLRGDEDCLRQILLNLIGNAVKFTERGRVVVRVLPVDLAENQLVLRFEVQDTGIGMSDLTLSKLFAPFVQADGSSSRKFGGTGLGLSISKRLVALMGGSMGVESRVGFGSLFWFTVPFARSHASQLARGPLENIDALLLSDDELLIDILPKYLSSWGIATYRVATTADASSRISAQPAARWIVIVDADSASANDVAAAIDGLETARMLTIGAGGRVAKPVRPSHLFDAIVTAFASEPPQAEASDAGRQPGASGPKPSDAVLVAEDNVRLQRLLVYQFEELGIPVKFVEDGLQAVEAVRNGRYAMLFMDCQMPNMDGFEATRAIRSEEARGGGHLPIVAMTANAFTEDREACLAAGMDDYLAKPVRIDDLRAATERWSLRPGP